MTSLTRIVPWSNQLAVEVLALGDLAVDLTAGKGRDTLTLSQAVGVAGRVVAFDVQQVALSQTAELMEAHGFAVRYWPVNQVIPEDPGIYLVHGCHSCLAKILHRSPKAIMANLGYLPGGNPDLITRPGTTQQTLEQALDVLAPGGRLTVTVYPAHPGGAEEGAVVNALMGQLPHEDWQVLHLAVANHSASPYLLVAERR